MPASDPTAAARRAYVALTPNQADFALVPPPSSVHPVDTLAAEQLYADPWRGRPRYDPASRWRPGRAVRGVRDFLELNAGLLFVTAAQAVFSLVNVAVKMLQSLDNPVSTLELIVVRMGITYICSVAYMRVLFRGIPNPFSGPEGVRLLLVFRGITGFVGLNGTYFSLQYLSLSDATVLAFLVPLCTAFAGSVFLKETFTRKEVIAGLCSLFGVVLIARPAIIFGEQPGSTKTDEEHRLLAIGIAMLGVLGSTGAMTSIRAIGTRAHPMHVLAFFSLQSVISASVLMVFLRTPVVIPTRLAWLGLLGIIGVLGFIAQILLTLGFQKEEAGRASMALYSQIIFASILERIFFSETRPSFLSFLGTSIIVASAVYVAATKRRDGVSSKRDADGDVELEEGTRLLSPRLKDMDGDSDSEVDSEANRTSSRASISTALTS
ncbi:Aldo-keto reductase [Mycena kentingensis (nom. inval.)]|nr:Aldo-keto reductase [Mycena kentingensis (nom. inval.)]